MELSTPPPPERECSSLLEVGADTLLWIDAPDDGSLVEVWTVKREVSLYVQQDKAGNPVWLVGPATNARRSVDEEMARYYREGQKLGKPQSIIGKLPEDP